MKKFFTLLMLSILTVMNVNAAEHVPWSGSYAIEWDYTWQNANATSELKSKAALGATLRLECERTASDYSQVSATIGWTEISVGGNDDNTRGLIDINGTATIDFVLTEKSMELINGGGDLVVIGHGFNLLKVTLVDAVPDTEEKVLWTGTHAVDWSTAWESSAELMTELKSVASVGTGLHLYCERTATDYCEGCATVNWANICTGGVDENRGNTSFKGNVLLNYVLTETSLQLLNEGNLGVVGHGFNLLKVTVVAPKSATAINQITSTPTQDNKVYYNLAGQRVENPGKGLYIVNGKKVMMK